MKNASLLLVLLFSMPGSKAQQTVTVSGSTPYSGTANYSQALTINGLPAGCVASIAGSVITVTGCPASQPISVSATCPSSTIQVGKTMQCAAVVSNSSNTAVTWTSTNLSVAAVNSSGLVTGAGTGTVSITAVSQADTTKSSSVSLSGTQAAAMIQVESETTTTSSGTISTASTQDTGGGAKLVSAVVGQTYDYVVNNSAASTYAIAVRLCNVPSGVGASTVHFEYPIGTDVTGPLSILNATQWTTFTSTKTFTLPAGNQTIRMKVDALASGGTQTNWFQLIPTGTVQLRNVQLNWAASTGFFCPAGQTCNPLPVPPPAILTNIYKRSMGGVYPATPLIKVTGTSFLDTGLASGTYGYVAKATATFPDGTVVESAPSNEATAIVP